MVSVEPAADFFSELAFRATEAAALRLRQSFVADAGVISQQGKDIKTQADLEASAILENHLKASGLPVFSEESVPARLASLPSSAYWLIDPLDGTFNFQRGFPMAAVSVALMGADGRPISGLIHHLFEQVTYTSTKPAAALQVSGVDRIDQAVLATGFPSGRSYDDTALLETVKRIQQFKKIRMLGSAACMLLEVAKGHFDVYLEEDIYLWDVAAGLALVAAAGGNYLIRPGSSRWKVNVVATNGQLDPAPILMSITPPS